MSAVSSVSSQVAVSGVVESCGAGNFEFTVEAFAKHMHTIGYLEISPGKSLTLIGTPVEMLMKMTEEPIATFQILDVLVGKGLKLAVNNTAFENTIWFIQPTKWSLIVPASEPAPLTFKASATSKPVLTTLKTELPDLRTTVKRVVDWINARGKEAELPLEPSRRIVFTSIGTGSFINYASSHESLMGKIKRLFFEQSVLLQQKQLSLNFDVRGPMGCFFTCRAIGGEFSITSHPRRSYRFLLETK